MIHVKRVQNVGKGITYALLAAFLFSVMGSIVKFSTTADIPVPMLAFFRQVFSLAAIAPFLLLQSRHYGLAIFKTERIWTYVARAAFSMVSMYCLFLTISLLPLSSAVLLSYMRPLFIPLVVWVWQRKKIEGSMWLGLLLGFVGVAFILRPERAVSVGGVALGLASSLCGAIAFLLIRRLGKSEPTLRIIVYYFLLSILIASVPLSWSWQTPTLDVWGVFLVLGVLGALYQTCLTHAYRYARATLVGSVLFSAIIFTLIWDWLFWHHLPDWISSVGILLICVGCMIAIRAARAKPAPGEQSAEAVVRSPEERKN